MKLFKCPSCGQVLYFENTSCVSCGRRVGYLAESDRMISLDEGPEGVWTAPASPGGSFRFCENAEHDACNWLIPAESGERFCKACRHNRTVPDTSDPQNLQHWRKIEGAKHRLIYTLLRLGLPLPGPGEADEPLVFAFLADTPDQEGPKVMTGHENGLITIALAEADDAERETRRAAMGEPYRTLVGHFRHEVGHFYWDRLIRDAGKLAECRAVFGDDSQDYEAALQRHYETGPPSDWSERYVSAYATTHPWEDFAETWAHYLHIVDTLEMATACRLKVAPVEGPPDLAAEAAIDVYAEPDMSRIVGTWLPVAFTMNSINRCMGQGDLYPFVLAPPVIEKLAFMHDLIRDARKLVD